MAVNSINTNIGAYFAQSNIGKASNMASSSIARLSSGDRIVRAADDVAAMSAGTSLRTNVTTLKMALVNTSQGASMLQVADGALSQITDILQRQKAIAVQSGAGSLSSSERSFLNQEFTNLTSEIDRLASQTNFNGVTLLDGSLFDITSLGQQSGAAERATGSVTISTYANIAALEGETIDLNGQTIEFDTNGATTGGNIAVDLSALTGTSTDLSQAITVLANTLNASTNTSISAATYEAVGNTLEIQARSGGNMSEIYEIDRASFSTNANFTVEGRLTNTANVFTLQGASEIGLARGDTVGVGTIGDGIINTQAQTAANISFNFTNATIANADTITIGDGAGGTFNFTFDTTTTVTNGLTIGIQNLTARADQLDAMVDALNSYTGFANNDFVAKQIEARREGDNVVIEKRETGNVVQTDGTTAISAFAASNGNVVLTGSTTLANGTNTGINTAGISNADFIGTVSGFQATYSGTANVIDLSVKVGSSTYSASAVNVGVDATIRFTSVEGDFFDIDFQGATQALSVGGATAQDQADNIATRLDTAFSTINFVQDREIASYSAAGDILTNSVITGSLTGSSFSLQSSDFTGAQIDDVRISAPVTGSTNGSIEFDINGVTYRSQNDIGTALGANSLTQFVSLEDGNDVLTFRNGGTAIQFDTTARAASFEAALETAFGFGKGGETLAFQVGVTTSDTLEVSIGTVTTSKLFNGETLDILTQATAANASDVIDAAIDVVTSVRADVGALQSRFDFAAANVESSIQNQDAARAVLLDTDIAAESTSYATAQVQLQAGISVLAQANLLPQNLLKLIG